MCHYSRAPCHVATNLVAKADVNSDPNVKITPMSSELETVEKKVRPSISPFSQHFIPSVQYVSVTSQISIYLQQASFCTVTVLETFQVESLVPSEHNEIFLSHQTIEQTLAEAIKIHDGMGSLAAKTFKMALPPVFVFFYYYFLLPSLRSWQD